MKLEDIFFAIGIIIISSLLVFVIYDDLTSVSYQEYINDIMQDNVTQKINISENDTKLLPTYNVNNTVEIKITENTKTSNAQTTNEYMITQKKNINDDSVQKSNSPNNNMQNNIHNYYEDSKSSSFSNNHNDREMRQHEPAKSDRMRNNEF